MMVCNKHVCVCVWKMVRDKVVCAKDGVRVCVCDKVVCDKDVYDKDVCSRWCVTMICVQDGV